MRNGFSARTALRRPLGRASTTAGPGRRHRIGTRTRTLLVLRSARADTPAKAVVERFARPVVEQTLDCEKRRFEALVEPNFPTASSDVRGSRAHADRPMVVDARARIPHLLGRRHACLPLVEERQPLPTAGVPLTGPWIPRLTTAARLGRPSTVISRSS